MEKLVSMVVPIYNTVNYLPRCIDSLINQSYKNLEIILVDDGSTDGSENICEVYKNNDSRIKVIHKQNGGESNARNAGLEVATGDYLMLSDSDDEYLPNAVEELMTPFNLEKVDLVIGSYLEVNGDKVFLATTKCQHYTADEMIAKMYLDKSPYGTMYLMSTVIGSMFKMNIIRKNKLKFNEHFVVGNDTMFVCDYMKYCRDVFDIFLPVYRYYKYDICERVQGMSWVYPDFYKLYLAYTEKYISYLKNDEKEYNNILHIVIDTLIPLLIKAKVYEIEFDGRFNNELRQIVDNRLVMEAMQIYKRTRLTDSETIPDAIKSKDIYALNKALFEKSEAIKAMQEKSKYVRMLNI
jgi:glycosyltransferase involved in cell wall biosynthesis